MAAKENLIVTTDITVNPREIDFVTRFQRNWQHLRDIMGIMRPIRMQPGTTLKSKYAEVRFRAALLLRARRSPIASLPSKKRPMLTLLSKSSQKPSLWKPSRSTATMSPFRRPMTSSCTS